MQNSDLFNLLGSFNFGGVSFVSIKGYKSDKSDNTEVADVLINVGESYENKKASDLKTLLNAKENIDSVDMGSFGKTLILEAIEAKIKSIVAPNENRSKGQTDAFIFLNEKGTLRFCSNTNNLLISGTVVRKTEIVKGEFKEVNSKPLTLAKNHLDKVLNLKMAKMRYYKISNASGLRVNGDTFEIG